MSAHEYLARILDVDLSLFESIDEVMSERAGRRGVLERVMEENERAIAHALELLQPEGRTAAAIHKALQATILEHEKQLIACIERLEGDNEFERAVHFAKLVTRVGKGFFLKRSLAEEILQKRPPEHVLQYLGLSNVEELLKYHDVTEVFSSLRFLESREWMHQTFEEAYSNFTANDFEERDIEVTVLGPEWKEVAEKFVEKKHHNVGHLKEFGVIFLNPIRMNIPGKFLRDVPLFLHYFHEIDFYSKLFRRYSKEDDFAERLKALLRGDVLDVDTVEEGEWLIVQRYLWKEDPRDPRLFLPRVNPESMHWSRGEQEVAYFGALEPAAGLEFWHDLDSVAGMFPNASGEDELVSFDLEDGAFTLASFEEGKNETFSYHQREAMWTKIFKEYVGGEAEMERLLLENFDKGVIRF